MNKNENQEEIKQKLIKQLKVGDTITRVSDKGFKEESTIDKLGRKYMNAHNMQISLSNVKVCSDGSLKFHASYGYVFYTNPDMYDIEKEALRLKREIINIVQGDLYGDNIELEKLRQIMLIIHQ